MKSSNIFTKFLIVVLSVILLGQILFTSIYTSPFNKYVLSSKPEKNKYEIESILIDKNKKRNGKTGTYVNISDTSHIPSLKEYARISNLYISDIDGSLLKDIKGLEIHSLVLQNVYNFDFSLPDMRNLFSITLINSPIKDCAPLSAAKNLTSINISDTEFDNWDFFKSYDRLTELNLSDIKLKDISFVKHTPQLEKLSIYNCNLTNISHIVHLPELKELVLSSNNISDISSVKNLKKLKSIIADHNNIEGQADFSNMENLTDVYLPFNQINDVTLHKDVSPLTIDISYNNITELNNEFIDTISKTDCKVNVFGNAITNHTDIKNIGNFCYQHMETSKTFTYDEHIKYIQAVKDFRKKYLNPAWSDIKKAAMTFCILSGKVKYFHNYRTSASKEAEYVHTEYGAMINNLAVCDGLSYALRDILRQEGIKSYIYHGDINSQSDDTGHAWNVIYIDSKPYHCDLTLGITKENSSAQFKYYNIEGYIENILSAFGKSDIYMENNNYFLTDTSAPKCTENISPSTISNIVYEICEGEEKYHFIDKEIFVEKGVIKNE